MGGGRRRAKDFCILTNLKDRKAWVGRELKPCIQLLPQEGLHRQQEGTGTSRCAQGTGTSPCARFHPLAPVMPKCCWQPRRGPHTWTGPGLSPEGLCLSLLQEPSAPQGHRWQGQGGKPTGTSAGTGAILQQQTISVPSFMFLRATTNTGVKKIRFMHFKFTKNHFFHPSITFLTVPRRK